MRKTAFRLLALLLALALASPAAQAAGTPALDASPGPDGNLVLTLTGLEQPYCGIQATLTLDQPEDAGFEPNEALFSSHPSIYYTYTQDGTEMTVYIVAKSPLNDGASLCLGTLTGSFSAASLQSLKLLTLDDLSGSVFDSGSSGGQESPQPPAQEPANPNPVRPSQPVAPPSGTQPAPSPVRYRVNAPASLENGTIEVLPLQAEQGETVTISISPDAGYLLDLLEVSLPDGSLASLSSLGGGGYSFLMPASDVTVRAAFAEAPQGPQAPAPLPFLDVPMGAWYYEAVSYAYSHDLMRGVDAYAFAPAGTTTRGQIVTILHRLEGEPPARASGGFSDVPADQWYASAVDWAASHAIVDGYGDDRFGPNDNITREQMAVILYRYAGYKGYASGQQGDLSSFADAGKVSSWALEAMVWANGSGLITGKEGNTLDPQGNATRAEAATILMRFCGDILQ